MTPDERANVLYTALVAARPDGGIVALYDALPAIADAIAAAVAAERERCARLCIDYDQTGTGFGALCAAVIRGEPLD